MRAGFEDRMWTRAKLVCRMHATDAQVQVYQQGGWWDKVCTVVCLDFETEHLA